MALEQYLHGSYFSIENPMRLFDRWLNSYCHRCRVRLGDKDLLVKWSARAEEVMARLAPIDFRASSMPVDSFVQTGIHHVGVLIHRTTEMQFEILTPVTWARSVWELICLNATPFGYHVEGKA